MSDVVIKQASDLPDWFDLKKYESVKQLGAEDWEHQLGVRHCIQVVLKSYRVDDATLELIASIQNNPILICNPEHRNCDSYWGDEFQKRPFNRYSLWSMSVMESYCHSFLHENLSDYWDACHRDYEALGATEQDKSMCNEPYDILLKKAGISNGGFNNLVVDLNSTDEELIADFKNWLKHYRKEIGEISRSKRYGEKDFNDWHVKRVLPFIDLMHWSRINNISITHKVLGDAIFPEEPNVDTTERIRKTTKPLALKLLQETTYRALGNQNITTRSQSIGKEVP